MRKQLSRTVIILSLVSLFTDIASEMLYPIMPIYLKSIGFSVLLIGILEGIAEATAGISKGYFGELSDRIEKRTPFIRLGYLLSALAKPALAISKWPFWIFIARTTERLGKGIRTSARDALLSDESTPKTRGRVFGFHRSMDTLGAAIGPIITLSLISFFPGNYNFIFVLTAIPGFAAILLTFLFREKHSKKAVNTLNKPKFSFLTFFNYWKEASTNYKHIVIGLILFTLINSSDAFLLLKVKDSGYSDSFVVGLYIFYNFSYALLSYPMGYLSDKLSMKGTIIIGLIAFSLTYLGFSILTAKIHFVILFGIYAAYAASTEGVVKAWLSNNLPRGRTATGLGLYNSLQSISTLIASSLAGTIWLISDSKTVFMISAIGSVIAAGYIAIFTKTNVTYQANV